MKFIELKQLQCIEDPRMRDSGVEYFSTFQYRRLGDIEWYGEDEWRSGEIVYQTTEEWKKELERVAEELRNDEQNIDYGILDDESRACDWDKYSVILDDGTNLKNPELLKAIANYLEA